MSRPIPDGRVYPDDPAGAAKHFGGGAASERQQQDLPRIAAAVNQSRDTGGQGLSFPRTSAGDNEQRAGTVPSCFLLLQVQSLKWIHHAGSSKASYANGSMIPRTHDAVYASAVGRRAVDQRRRNAGLSCLTAERLIVRH